MQHSHTYLAQDWEEFLSGTGHRIIHALIDSGLDPTFLLCDVINLHHLPWCEVAQAKLHQLAFLVHCCSTANGQTDRQQRLTGQRDC